MWKYQEGYSFSTLQLSKGSQKTRFSKIAGFLRKNFHESIFELMSWVFELAMSNYVRDFVVRSHNLEIFESTKREHIWSENACNECGDYPPGILNRWNFTKFNSLIDNFQSRQRTGKVVISHYFRIRDWATSRFMASQCIHSVCRLLWPDFRKIQTLVIVSSIKSISGRNT